MNTWYSDGLFWFFKVAVPVSDSLVLQCLWQEVKSLQFFSCFTIPMQIIWPWPPGADLVMTWSPYDKGKRKHKVVRLLWDFDCLYFSQYIEVHIELTVNKADIRIFIAWIKPPDWIPCTILVHSSLSNLTRFSTQ